MSKVSVLMPIYKTNHRYLREAIESILNQTYEDFEFLILNDSPDDESLDDVVESYTDKRIKYMKNEKNLGITSSRNKLIDLAKGEYLAVMDHDDISLLTRFEKQVKFLDENPVVGVVGCWYKRFPNEKIKKKREFSREIEFDLTHSCAILHPASMIRKSVFVDNDVCYNAGFSPAEDYNLWIDFVGLCDFYNLQEVLFLYRDHQNNASKVYAEKMCELREIILLKYKQKCPEFFSYRKKLMFFFKKCLD